MHEEGVDHLVAAVLELQGNETLIALCLVHAQVGAVQAPGNERTVFQVAVVVDPELIGVEDPLRVPGHLLAGVLRHHGAFAELAEQTPELLAVAPPVETAIPPEIGVRLKFGPHLGPQMRVHVFLRILDAPTGDRNRAQFFVNRNQKQHLLPGKHRTVVTIEPDLRIDHVLGKVGRIDRGKHPVEDVVLAVRRRTQVALQEHLGNGRVLARHPGHEVLKDLHQFRLRVGGANR